ncbi:MAG: aminoacetone oxidase family FAD-binding enzyme [candidate division WOR-3 bacterium]
MLLAVIGGGAGGLVCALVAARLGIKVVLLEKTDRCGHKLALTGGRKCNFSHAESPRAMAARFDAPAGLLLPLLKRFPYQRIVDLFASLGIGSRVDSAGCIWAAGANAALVRDRLVQAVVAAGVSIRTGAAVRELKPGWEVVLADQTVLRCDSVCLATGGASYPQTGSTGDGLRLAAQLGISTTPWFAALASLQTKTDLNELAGISHPQVRMAVLADGRVLKETTGHFLFAHQFVTGSGVLNLCGYAARALLTGQNVQLRIDWVPDKSHEALRSGLTAACKASPKARVTTILRMLVSRRLGARLVAESGIPADRRACQLNRSELDSLVRVLKSTVWEVTGTEPLARATVSGGGIRLEEIDLNRMAVKRLTGLYCIGELLDTWAETGGYNLHFAWSTAIAAAEAVSGRSYD